MSKYLKLNSKDKAAVFAAASVSEVNGVVPTHYSSDVSTWNDTQKQVVSDNYMNALAAATPVEQNIMIEELTNKVLVSLMYKRMNFQCPLTKAFINTSATAVSAITEIFDNQLLKATDYDRDKRYPAAQTRAKTLNTFIKTKLKQYITNTLPMTAYQAAFASGTGAGQWLANQTKLLADSMQVIMFEYLTKDIDTQVLNVKTIAGTPTWEAILLEAIKVANNMKVPSIKYNMGFANPSDAGNADKVRKGISSMERLVMIGHSDIRTYFENVGTVKFHNAFFKVSQFKDYIAVDLPTTQLIMVDETAFEGYFRVHQTASNTWAGNLTIEMFLHYWLVFGSIPWALGVKFKFAAPTPTPPTSYELENETTEEVKEETTEEVKEETTEEVKEETTDEDATGITQKKFNKLSNKNKKLYKWDETTKLFQLK